MKKLFTILLLIAAAQSHGQAGTQKAHKPAYPPAKLPQKGKNGKQIIDTVFNFWVSANLHCGLTNSSITNAGTLSTTFNSSAALGGDVQLAYFFGKSAVVGITAGLSWSSFSGKLTEDQYSETINGAMTDNANPNRPSRPFTQIISLTKDAVVEEVSLHSFSLPVTAAWRGYFSPRVGFQVEVGPVFNLHYTGTMNSTNAKFDYEAIYNYQDIGRYLPGTGNNNPAQAFEITKSMAAKYNMTGPQYLAYMGSAAGGSYPVGTGITPSSLNSSATFASGNISFLVRAGVSCYLSRVWSINVVAFFQSGSVNNNTADYQLINEKKYYNTLLNGIANMHSSMAGLRIGISHALFYKTHKVLPNKPGKKR